MLRPSCSASPRSSEDRGAPDSRTRGTKRARTWLALFTLSVALVEACSSEPDGPSGVAGAPGEPHAGGGGVGGVGGSAGAGEPEGGGANGGDGAGEPGGRAGQGGEGGGATEELGGAPALGGAGSDGGGAGASAAPPVPPGPYPRPDYQRLSETGYWSDAEEHVLADGIEPYEPTYKLWSDAADKRRWIALPAGAQIDTSDMDHWEFPIGTRLWKEFSVDGVPVETRLVERYGSGPKDYWLGAFVWTSDGSDADFVLEGEVNARGTEHDVPSQEQCWSCHNGDAGKVLGFSALQLPAEDEHGLDWTELRARGWLSVEPSFDAFSVPGDAVTASAFGYLHANCGHCHNPRGLAWTDTQMVLRLSVLESVAEETALYRTVVGKKVQYTRNIDIPDRVLPGNPEGSAILVRMQNRGSPKEMPALGTEQVDPDGVESVRAWIESLSAGE